MQIENEKILTGKYEELNTWNYNIFSMFTFFSEQFCVGDDSWDIRTAFLNYPDKVLVTPGQDS